MRFNFLIVLLTSLGSVSNAFAPPAHWRYPHRTQTSARSTLLSVLDAIDDETRTTSERRDSKIFLSDDVQRELQSQDPNEDAPAFDYLFQQDDLTAMESLDEEHLNRHKRVIHHKHFTTLSLDVLFPNLNFSSMFNSNSDFRSDLRQAIRRDMIADDASIYGTNKQEHQELLKRNKPLIGYWKKEQDDATRMNTTTDVLQRYLGSNAPTGDDFMTTIGSLCNSTQAPFHWTEVVGVAATQNGGNKTSHGWHQDYGRLDENDGNNYHVFFAFPPHNNYTGTGVFSHLIKLKHEQWAKPIESSNINKPTFYRGLVPEQYIVRPLYIPGQAEIIVFRDVDVLHSSPDIQYRTSIMRFG